MRTEIKNRPRHVVFRVSEEEHEYLCQACGKTGVRSLSEFVRQAALHYAQTQRSSHTLLSDDLTTVALRLEEVDTYLRELSKVIERVLGPARRSTPNDAQRSKVQPDSPLESEEVRLKPIVRLAERFASGIPIQEPSL